MKVRLGDVCDILNGFAFKSENYVATGIRIIRIANVQKGYIEDSLPCFYPLEQGNSFSRYMLNKGDLLISLTGNVGRVALLHNDMLPAALNQRVACLRLKRKDILIKYLFHLMNSDKFELDCVNSSKGIAQKNMSTEWLKEYKLDIPSLETQQKEIYILDKINTLIEKRKQQLEKLDLLVKSKFIEMFGNPEFNTKNFPIAKLGDLCNVGSSKRIYQNEQTKEGVQFLRIADLNNRIDGNENSCELFISEKTYDSLIAIGLVPVVGDILMTARGTLGRCYIVKASDRFYFQDGMITWLSKFVNKVTSLYISYLFESHGIKKQIAGLQAGSTVAYLSIAMTKKLDIMCPPIDLQNEFTHFIDQTDKIKTTIKQSLEKLETLKKALMQKYFG